MFLQRRLQGVQKLASWPFLKTKKGVGHRREPSYLMCVSFELPLHMFECTVMLQALRTSGFLLFSF